MLPQPATYTHWDPLLQRTVAAIAPSILCAATPSPPSRTATVGRSQLHPTTTPDPLPAAPSAHQSAGEDCTPQQPLNLTGGAAATPTPPPTPAELEASSLALAWRLQQEEQEDFMRAMRVNTPTHGQGQVTSASEGIEQMDTDDDESLQLAIRLQQEELHWQELQSRQGMLAAFGGSEEGLAQQLDEDSLAALQGHTRIDSADSD